MFFILSKTLQFAINPLVWIISLFIIGILTSKTRKKKIYLCTSLLLLLFFSNEYLSAICFKKFEGEPQSISSIKHHDIGIILTGVVQTTIEQQDRVFFSKGADRVTHTLQLYKEGKIDKILISGGSGFLLGNKQSEALLIRKFLLMTGVKQQHIIIDSTSRNTRENALNSFDIISKIDPKPSILLVTSAFHMKRASGCFRKVGLEFNTLKTDFRSPKVELNIFTILVPSTEALQRWDTLIHEYVGQLTYSLVGYS